MKSQIHVYVSLVSSLYSDLSSALVTEREVRRDLDTIRRRVDEEGLSFLTKTLPRLGKAVDRALSSSSQLDIPNFRKEKGSRIPHFMRSLLKLLFSLDGYPLQDAGPEKLGSGSNDLCRETPSVAKQTDALRAVRQISYLFYKLETQYTEAQVNEVITSFTATEAELWDGKCRSPLDMETERLARSLCHRVLNEVDPFAGIPRHGPGSVATGERHAEKHVFSRWYDLLTEVFPWDQWFVVSPGATCDAYHRVGCLESHETGTAKVVLVPKDSRGPRLISCEPLEYQWVQQALCSTLVDQIEKHPITAGHVNFTDQTVNRRLALEGSLTGKWVTLDMKEASDRVSVHHVAGLFPDRWCEALFASRTTRTKLPDGRIVHLNKMSPMGSAVCFPIESITFWSLCVAHLALLHAIPVSLAREQVYVYGDDIVVSSAYHASIPPMLERFGLKTNPQKCCTQGPFRESCGADAYKGNLVSPVRLKKQWSSRRSPEVLLSWVALSNNLWSKGYWASAEYVASLLREVWGDQIPTSPVQLGCACFVRPELPLDVPSRCRTRFNPSTHRREIQALSTRPSSEMTKTEGYPLLLRLLAEAERSRPSSEDDCGSRVKGNRQPTGSYPIAHRNKLCRAWTPVDI